MLQFDEYKVKLNNLLPALKELAQALDLDGAERELDMLQAESAADGFWDNLAKAQKEFYFYSFYQRPVRATSCGGESGITPVFFFLRRTPQP